MLLIELLQTLIMMNSLLMFFVVKIWFEILSSKRIPQMGLVSFSWCTMSSVQSKN